jgi:NADH-ubiquinone oxidoreductase chain 5
MFGFFLLFLSTGLTVCYSFRLFYFVMYGDFNFFSSYSMGETNYNIMFGMIGLLVITVFGGSGRQKEKFLRSSFWRKNK